MQMLQLLLHVSTFACLLRFFYDINIILYRNIMPDNSCTRKHISCAKQFCRIRLSLNFLFRLIETFNDCSKGKVRPAFF